MSLLNTAITGLKAQQEALRVTGHNISNANTPGYSRQEVVLAAEKPLFRGFGFVGQGVDVTSVRRITDQFMISQQRTDTSAYHNLNAYRSNIEQVDRLIADDRTSLQPQLDRFFASLQGGADNPAYIPSRDVVIGESQGLVERFKTLHKYLTDLNGTLNSQIDAMVGEINALADGIAQLNEEILSAQGSPTRTPPNDLIDKRDELVRQLSELIKVDVVPDGERYNISIGNGQALVIGNDANRLAPAPGVQDPERFGVRFVSNVENLYVTDQLEGGQLGGLLRFRQDALDPALNNLGRIAVGLVQNSNAQHRLGIDLNGNFGQDLFRDLNDPDLAVADRVRGNALNELPRDQVLSVYFEDPGALTTSDYNLKFTGPADFNYEVVRTSDGQVVKQGSLPGEPPQDIEFDGLRVSLESGRFKAGDEFTIQPLRAAANQVELLIRDPAELAFAYPMRAQTSLGNQGSGTIDQGQMLSRDSNAFNVDGQLTPPLIIVFETPDRYSVLDNSDPGNPVPLEPPLQNIEYIPGTRNTIFTDDPGETLVSSWRPRLPQDPTITAGGTSALPPYNGINTERFTFSRTDPATGQVTQDPTIITRTGASAAEIAEQLNRVEGVTARAYSEVQLTNFTNSGTPYDPDNPFEIWVNGYEITLDDLGPNQNIFMDGYPETLPEELGPNFLADRINAHYDLRAAGVTAKSDGQTLTIRDAKGNDIFIEMRGDKPQDVVVGAPPVGGGPPNNAIDPGDTFELSTGERWPVEPIAGNTRGQLNNLTGFDFSTGGPYQFEMYLPDGRTGTIELTGDHATSADVKAEIEQKIGALLDSPGRVQASITARGEIEYQVFMKVSGTGNSDTAGVNVGGQVDVTMADGISLRTRPEAGAIFTGIPEAQSTYKGFQFEIGGRPEAGDSFSIDWNRGGVSDNRNVLDLVGLETTKTVNSRQGGMTFTEAYSQAVEQVGTKTRQAQIQTDAARGVLDSTEEELNSVRGVNLDEEAARLIEFQLAYNANAQSIRIAQETFDTLIGAFR
ncbi:MAG: flagellar hook-associated protein FlgK [Saccharospirillum sp.]